MMRGMTWEQFEERLVKAVRAKAHARGRAAPEVVQELGDLLGLTGFSLAQRISGEPPCVCDRCGRADSIRKTGQPCPYCTDADAPPDAAQEVA